MTAQIKLKSKTVSLKDKEDELMGKSYRHGRRGSLSKSRSSGMMDHGGPRKVGLDYSHTYKENDVLDDDLEEKLVHLDKDENRAIADKGEKLQELRKQMEIITRLQEAVNANSPGQSIALLHNTRAANKFGEGDSGEFGRFSKMSKTEMRIMMEREKFSAKNMFNRRPATAHHDSSSSYRHGFGSAHRPVPPPLKRANTWAQKVRAMKNQEGHLENGVDNEIEDEDGDDDDDLTGEGTLYEGEYSFDYRPESSSPTNRRTGQHRERAKTAGPRKNYQRETMSSLHGRPRTAIGASGIDEVKYDELLPPRAQSALRSRSRRELEVLSRIAVKGADEPVVDEYGLTNWKVVWEKKRRTKLKELRSEGELLQTKVKNFMADIETFNKRPKSTWKRNVSS